MLDRKKPQGKQTAQWHQESCLRASWRVLRLIEFLVHLSVHVATTKQPQNYLKRAKLLARVVLART
jgi:hypothetical protein